MKEETIHFLVKKEEKWITYATYLNCDYFNLGMEARLIKVKRNILGFEHKIQIDHFILCEYESI